MPLRLQEKPYHLTAHRVEELSLPAFPPRVIRVDLAGAWRLPVCLDQRTSSNRPCVTEAWSKLTYF